VLALLLARLALAAPPALPAPAAALLVRDGRFVGSGVVWDATARRVLTALHVVEEMDPRTLEVVGASGLAFAARVADRDPSLDLAVLEVAGPLDPGPPVGASAALVTGDAVAWAGCPAARCASGEGRVLEASRSFAGSRYLALAASVAPGASGGPVVDREGALVGIVDLALRREPGVALAVPIERAVARFPRS
jgi:S1-C subfamily serine protease